MSQYLAYPPLAASSAGHHTIVRAELAVPTEVFTVVVECGGIQASSPRRGIGLFFQMIQRLSQNWP